MSDKNAAHLIHRLRFRRRDHKASPFMPHSRAPIMAGRESNNKRMAMTEKEERLARDRAEIAARVASFRKTQQKFERERKEYYETTLANALNGSSRSTLWR
ncbi:hypothetical protein [Bradyrhizobium retamae]|uniref:Uncharacterized protein n=1 Tax=Bradyrhizobium retamae TaxID=1300035 RepID=A0A0R3MTD0_9BRAD|nr:hypothetical protein [Bradyrhizobium retamae]KRR23131.1 hypothetical protein CQ13_28030 [Bradyrhizobium retamae]